MSKSLLLWICWSLALLSLSTNCLANELTYLCDATLKNDSADAPIAQRQVKFGVVLSDENGKRNVGITGNASLVADGVALEYVAGSCVNAAYPVCDIGIDFNDNQLSVKKTKYSKGTTSGKYGEIVSASITIDRQSGELDWIRTSTVNGDNGAESKGNLITIKGRCSSITKK